MNLLPLAITWDVNPAIFTIFGLEIRWYALSWILAIVIGYQIFQRIMKREQLAESALDYFSVALVVCMILGSRLGHLLFYDFQNFIKAPWIFFYFRQGGFASHGAALGILLSLWFFARKAKLPYMWGLDRVAIVVPIGGAAIRIGNLMNSEIYGSVTDLPWGFIFARNGETLPMHPTQIYEALAYLALFFVMWYMYFKKDVARKQPGLMIGVMLVWLFLARFGIETIKWNQVAFEEGMALNMGQILSIPFIAAGIALIVWSFANRKKHPEPVDPVKNSFFYIKNQPKPKKK
ncbi:prolipoprotein diacylglyceryl transferase [Alistipes sp. OttesenSCG-928-L06]|nr:prolipoprotein diacylglyceryl transferase [Alistipes sp. OttesenSCG-928-L06]